MNLQDGGAMFELQLELHARATGRLPKISADEILELHDLLTEFAGDLKALTGTASDEPSVPTGASPDEPILPPAA
jgi:hypothetical protein